MIRDWWPALKKAEWRSLIYLFSDLARLLAFGRCLSQSARALSFLHGDNT